MFLLLYVTIVKTEVFASFVFSFSVYYSLSVSERKNYKLVPNIFIGICVLRKDFVDLYLFIYSE